MGSWSFLMPVNDKKTLKFHKYEIISNVLLYVAVVVIYFLLIFI